MYTDIATSWFQGLVSVPAADSLQKISVPGPVAHRMIIEMVPPRSSK